MQLSRPFQIVLVTFCLFAAVWFFALRSHSSSTSGGGSSASAPPSAASPAAQPATPSTPYHGSAPGVAGLTRAIEKARGAVTQSEQQGKRLQQKAAQASGEASGGTAPNASKPGAQSAHAVRPKAATTAPKRATTVPKSAASATAGRAAGQSKSNAAAAPVMQATVEGALKRGKVVTVLFWNPKGIVDQAVHRELQSVGPFLAQQGRRLCRRREPGQLVRVLHESRAGQRDPDDRDCQPARPRDDPDRIDRRLLDRAGDRRSQEVARLGIHALTLDA